MIKDAVVVALTAAVVGITVWQLSKRRYGRRHRETAQKVNELVIDLSPERASAALELLQLTADRREQRRGYEWKVTLTLWGGLLLGAKVVADADGLKGAIGPGASPWWSIGLAILLGLVVAGHFGYHWRFVRRAQDDDLEKALQLEKEINSATGLAPLPSGASPGWWSSGFQVYVTALLCLLVYFVVRLTVFATS